MIFTIDAASSDGSLLAQRWNCVLRRSGSLHHRCQRPRKRVVSGRTPRAAVDRCCNYAPTCATVAYQDPSAPDGNYTLDVQGVSTTIYCADMSTTPAEYLSLPAGTSTNFSQRGSRLGRWFHRSYRDHVHQGPFLPEHPSDRECRHPVRFEHRKQR